MNSEGKRIIEIKKENKKADFGRMELLAPAGSWDGFKAAVENGADAVYLGGKSFSARSSAANFDQEELVRAVNYAHERKVKVYVAVNILVADQEFSQLIDYVYDLYGMGVDGLILQDIGAAQFIRDVLPEMEIHASTQMTVNTSWGVKSLEKLGFSRVVLARETSLKEMGEIRKKSALEMEVFVHGALCICYSGQCLMSSFIGGRSGNRGTCAQPCRMAYQLVNRSKEDVLEGRGVGEHLLSPRDLNLVDYLEDLREAGVNSLKIEGRMKRPEYVATVTRVYRQALKAAISEDERYELTQIFNREFTPGYMYEHPGADLMSFARPNNRGTRLGRVVKTEGERAEVKLENRLHPGDGIEVWTKRGREGITVDRIWKEGRPTEEGLAGETVSLFIPGRVGLGDRIFKTNDAVLMEKAGQSFQEGKEQKKRPIALRLFGAVGEKLGLEGECEGKRLTVWSAMDAQQALKRPLTEDYAKEHLARLGNTPFVLDKFIFDVSGEAMLPVRELNDMRREWVDEFLTGERFVPQVTRKAYEQRTGAWMKGQEKLREEKTNHIPRLTVAVRNLSGLEGATRGGADRVILDGEHWRSQQGFKEEELYKASEVCRKNRCEPVWRLPRILNEGQSEALFKRLQKVSETENRPKIMVSNLAELAMVQEIDCTWPFEIDYSLNVFNQAGFDHFLTEGAQSVTLSPELNYEQLKLFRGRQKAELMIFGDLEMMVSEYCPVGATLGEKKGKHCTRPCVGQPYFLKDRMNFSFPMETDMECRMHLYNVKQLNLYQELDALTDLGLGSLRLQMVRATEDQIYQVTSIFYDRLIRLKGDGDSGRNGDGEFERGKSRLESLFPEGFTKGHFFRGVLK